VQVSVLPPSDNVQVSLCVGPVTPNTARASVGRVTDKVAVAVPPPYDAVMVPVMFPPTARVSTVNDALVCPAGTVTVGGASIGSLAASVTMAPSAGANPVSVTVAGSGSPPTTLLAPSVTDSTVTVRDAVSETDCALLPLKLALMVADPALTPVAVNDAASAPAGIATDAGTLMTDELLLDSETAAPLAGAAALRRMVPCAVPPMAMLAPLNDTAATVMPPLDGWVGDPELLLLQPAMPTIAATTAKHCTRFRA
jgi:hypothetical protein